MDITPTHVIRRDAIHMLFAKLEEELHAAGFKGTSHDVKFLHDRWSDVPRVERHRGKLEALIPNEDLATWIDG